MSPTPAVAREFDLDEDVSLDNELDDDENVHLADLSRTSPHPGGAVVYPHGFSMRFRLLLPKREAVTTLAAIGWQADNPNGWKTYTPRSGRPRYVMEGTTWLVHTAPRDKRHPLTKFNTKHKVRLYGIAIEETKVGYEVDLLGVRIADVTAFFERVLGLTAGHYALMYYRQAERYLVLDAPEAHRLADELGGVDRFSGGRLTRKRNLLKELPLDPIAIRARAKATPILNLYRIEPGATAPFRLEVRLRGRRADRAQFHAADIATLDAILLDLVKNHALDPKLKPARWEPRSKRSRVERGDFDPHLAKLPMAAYRGRKLSSDHLASLRKCHTPARAKLIATSQDDDIFSPPTRVRPRLDDSGGEAKGRANEKTCTFSTSVSSTTPVESTYNSIDIATSSMTWKLITGGPTAVTLYRHADDGSALPLRPKFRDAYDALAHEIAALKGYVSEVVLNAEEPPMPIVEALIHHAGCRVGVGVIAIVDAAGHADTWLPLLPLADEHPLDDDIETLVLVFDTSISVETEDLTHHFDEDTFEWTTRPGFEHEAGRFEEDPLSRSALPLGATYWPVLAELRNLAEKGGLSVVLVTSDFRKPTGYGELRRTHYYTDARVRSLLGDAARYSCHVRYRVENGVVTLKDEAEGKTGRYV